MSEDVYQRLVEGYRRFQQEYVGERYAAYRAWAAHTQKPKVMVIACSDSRVNPAILTNARLGDLFMVNNVANLVPPYKEGHDTHHSTSAALEFAVCALKVEHVIVLGHAQCGGIRALMEGVDCKHPESYSFIEPWMQIAAEAKQRVLRQHPDGTPDQQACHCEKEALLVSLKNLLTFPWVKLAVEESRLQTHAWYFAIESGDMQHYDEEKGEFFSLMRG